jgi:hypothetical protein
VVQDLFKQGFENVYSLRFLLNSELKIVRFASSNKVLNAYSLRVLLQDVVKLVRLRFNASSNKTLNAYPPRCFMKNVFKIVHLWFNPSSNKALNASSLRLVVCDMLLDVFVLVPYIFKLVFECLFFKALIEK